MFSIRRALPLLAFTLAVTAVASRAATFTVDNLSDDAGQSACTAAANDCSLRGALLRADGLEDADTINFGVTGTITLTDARMDVFNDVTISGPPSGSGGSVTVDGDGQFGLLAVNSGTVQISDLTLTNGSNQNDGVQGGAIYNQGTLTLTRCTVSNSNSPNQSGGGIFNSGDLTLLNCTLSGNATNGQGGGVDNTGTLTVTGGTISGNKGVSGGGIVNENGATLTLTGATISGNNGNANGNFGAGGGIYNQGTLTESGNTYSTNSASQGGGLYAAGELNSSGSTFSKNTATGEGGGLFFTGFPGEVTDVTFTGNSAPNGGGLYNQSSLTVSGGTFSGNKATSTDLGGGGIYNGSSLTLSGATLSGNTSTFDGGGIYNGSGLQMTSVTLSSNTATHGGGALYNGGTTNLFDSTLAGNSTPGNGGAISNQGSLSATRCTLSGNSATGFGGGTYNVSFADFSNSTLSGNSANRGGGVYNTSYFQLQSATLASNSASIGGGVFNVASSSWYAVNSILSQGGASGGTVRNGTNVNLSSGGYNLSDDNSTATPNTSTDRRNLNALLGPLADNGGPTQTHALLAGSPAINKGQSSFDTDQRGIGRPQGGADDIGAFEKSGSQIGPSFIVTNAGDSGDSFCDAAGVGDGCSLREAVFAANSNADFSAITFAPGVAGTITLGGSQIEINSDLSITGPTTSGTPSITVSGNNQSTVFFVSSSFTVALTALKISDGNDVISQNGGGIHSDGVLSVTNCTFSGNTSNSYGGAIYNSGFSNGSGVETLTVTNCRFDGNTASSLGGAIMSFNGMNVSASSFSGNSASSGGGAIYSQGNPMTLANCAFSTNTSNSTGNAVYSVGPGNISDCTFSGNSNTNSSGSGALFHASSEELVIARCTFADNSDGAIINSGTITLTASTLAGNTTVRDGGGIYNTGTLTVTNSTLSGNSATGDFNNGGGIYNVGTLALTNVTLADNSAVGNSSDGGNIYNTSDLTIGNTILSNGSLFNNGGTVTSQGYNISSDASGPNNGSTDLLNTDANLGPLADNGGPTQTRALGQGSPAINTGNTALTTDQRGLARPFGAADDIGAFESDAPVTGGVSGTTVTAKPIGIILTSDPAGATFEITGGPAHGTAVLTANSDGRTRLFYRSNSDFPAAGTASDVDTVQFVAISGTGTRSAPATATITVNANRVPIADPVNGTIGSGALFVATLTGRDPDDGNAPPNRYGLVNAPANGTASISKGSDGISRLYYRSTNGFVGTDTFQFRAVDAQGAYSDPATATIQVTSNAAPTTQDVSGTVQSDKLLALKLTGSDPDGSIAGYKITRQPTNGRAAVSRGSDGVFVLFYRSNAGYTGPDSIGFVAIGSQGARSAPGNASITVTGAPSADSTGGSGGHS